MVLQCLKTSCFDLDDGYADTYSIVYPIMKEYGFPATVFINPGDIGTRLTWDQVQKCIKWYHYFQSWFPTYRNGPIVRSETN